MVLPPQTAQLLLVIRRCTADGTRLARYDPATWFGVPGTPSRRQRWSRAAKQLEGTGLIERITEQRRNRVRDVTLTDAGRKWLAENAGPFCDIEIEELVPSSMLVP